MKTRYHVVWEIDIEAESPREAAEEAWAIMCHPDSNANYFEVFDQNGDKTNVDLMDEAGVR